MENGVSSMPTNPETVVLELYVSGMSPRSMEALRNIKQICDKYLPDQYTLEVVDIYKNPEIAKEKHIVFCPSLIKRFPVPEITMIGNLSDTEKVLKNLGVNNKNQ